MMPLPRRCFPARSPSVPDRGSFPPDGLWSGYGGRAYSTALAALALEAVYRYDDAAK